jgi:cytochrome c
MGIILVSSALIPIGKINMNIQRILGIAVLLTLANIKLVQAADLARGTHVFNEECAECHSPKEGKNKKGPSVWNVVGRKSASITDFNYSDNMRNSNIVWSADQIAAYIEHPKKVVPTGKMKYDGLADAKDREDVITYLSSLH